jgi:hypothetical protein
VIKRNLKLIEKLPLAGKHSVGKGVIHSQKGVHLPAE